MYTSQVSMIDTVESMILYTSQVSMIDTVESMILHKLSISLAQALVCALVYSLSTAPSLSSDHVIPVSWVHSTILSALTMTM